LHCSNPAGNPVINTVPVSHPGLPGPIRAAMAACWSASGTL